MKYLTLLTLSLLANCAFAAAPALSSLKVNTIPSGASCKLISSSNTDSMAQTTPFTAKVNPTEALTISCTKPGYSTTNFVMQAPLADRVTIKMKWRAQNK